MPVVIPVSVGVKRTCRVTVCFGFNFSGNVSFEMLNPDPSIAMELMTTGSVPVDESVIGCVDDEPTVTFPKLKSVGFTRSCGVDSSTPVPLRETFTVLLVEEFEVMASDPVYESEVDGAN